MIDCHASGRAAGEGAERSWPSLTRNAISPIRSPRDRRGSLRAKPKSVSGKGNSH